MKMKKVLSVFAAMIMLISLICASAATVSAEPVTVSFGYNTITVAQGKALTLKPTIKGVSDYTIVWSTSDSKVASVTSKGKVSGLKKGTAVVTAKIKGTSKSASVKIAVGKRVTSVSVPETSVSLKTGDTYKISAKLSPSDAAYKAVSYSVSDKKILSVKGSTVTALKSGKASVTVKSADGSGKKTQITFTVSDDTSDKAKKPTAKTAAEPATNGFDTSLTAFDMTAKITVGWNLGNSLDAISGSGLSAETSWGNPKTTEKMIKDIKAAGFNTIRIPTSWGIHSDANGNVDKEWMDRVQEVVDYAYKNNMYVILNSHHDNAYYQIGKMAESEDACNASIKKMSNVWKQISRRFKNYDHKLMFETLNEPRTEGSRNEWSGGTQPERDVLVKLNQAIVSTIRSTGGNNAYRFILVPAYAATSSTNILRQTEFPDDDRVIVSVHAYSPYNFAMNASGSSAFSDNDKKELDRFFSDLDSIFIQNGRAVIIGETGATNKNNDEDRKQWAVYFINGASKYHIPCVMWDNNSKSGSGAECFGLYNRNTGEMQFPDYVQTITDAGKTRKK